jgi:hypothetical protein
MQIKYKGAFRSQMRKSIRNARPPKQHRQSDPWRISSNRGAHACEWRADFTQRKRPRRAAFLSRGWSSRGPRPRARCRGGEYPRGTHRKHRSREHRALTWFQSCFVRRGNGFIGRLGSGVWFGSNTLGWSKAGSCARRSVTAPLVPWMASAPSQKTKLAHR